MTAEPSFISVRVSSNAVIGSIAQVVSNAASRGVADGAKTLRIPQRLNEAIH